MKSKITKKALKIIGIKMGVALIALAIELLVIMIMILIQEKGDTSSLFVKPSGLLLPFAAMYISNYLVQYGVNYEDFIDCKSCEKSSAAR